MANPQAENGHIDIANEIIERFASLQLSGNQWRILWVILRQTYGWKKKTERISISTFEKKTGLKRRHISRAIKDLHERNIVTKNDTNFISSYGLQKDYLKWKLSPKMTYVKNGDASSPKMTLKPSPKLVDIKEKKETTKKKGPVDPAIFSLFESFYQAYPKHEGRKKAFDAWKKIKPNNGLQKIILQAIEKQKAHKGALKAKGEFAAEWPLPASWLNGKRWEDEIPEVKSGWK